MCDGKDWLNLTNHGTPASRTITCSDTAQNTTTCNATVSNCKQSSCYKTSGGTVSKVCAMCEEGYTASGTQVDSMFYPSCTKSTITNCDYHNPSTPTKCMTCKSDYAVANNDLTCTSFTTDSNCRKLGTGNTYCYTCWMAYYFDTKTCLLGGKILAFVGSLMMAAYALY